MKTELNVLLCVYNFQEVAVKLESQKARHPQLLYESKLYKILQGGVGIPHIRYCHGSWNMLYLSIVVLDLIVCRSFRFWGYNSTMLNCQLQHYVVCSTNHMFHDKQV